MRTARQIEAELRAALARNDVEVAERLKDELHLRITGGIPTYAVEPRPQD